MNVRTELLHGSRLKYAKNLRRILKGCIIDCTDSDLLYGDQSERWWDDGCIEKRRSVYD